MHDYKVVHVYQRLHYKYVEHWIRPQQHILCEYLLSLSICKKTDFVCQRLLMHSAVLRRMEPKLIRVVGARCPRGMVNFLERPNQRSKVRPKKKYVCLSTTDRPTFFCRPKIIYFKKYFCFSIFALFLIFYAKIQKKKKKTNKIK